MNAQSEFTMYHIKLISRYLAFTIYHNMDIQYQRCTLVTAPVEAMVASWLVHLTLERAVQVLALAGTLCCIFGQDTLLSKGLSPPRPRLFESRLTLTQD